jgi:hypothetical protein
MKLERFITLFLSLALIYFIIASWTFAIRHPWATQTEILISFPKVVTFQSVPYEEMRDYERLEK